MRRCQRKTELWKRSPSSITCSLPELDRTATLRLLPPAPLYWPILNVIAIYCLRYVSPEIFTTTPYCVKLRGVRDVSPRQCSGRWRGALPGMVYLGSQTGRPRLGLHSGLRSFVSLVCVGRRLHFDKSGLAHGGGRSSLPDSARSKGE
jgi:hypothetical protein